MKISKNTQLGLMIRDKSVKIDLYTHLKDISEERMDRIQQKIKESEEYVNSSKNIKKLVENGCTYADLDLLIEEVDDNDIIDLRMQKSKDVVLEDLKPKYNIYPPGIKDNDVDRSLVETENSKHYLICESVYKAAELIKIGESFTSRTFKDIKLGKYVYLLGKDRMVSFGVGIGLMNGFYWGRESRTFFEFFLNIKTGKFHVDEDCPELFSELMKIITFVELGDIEVTTLEGGKSNNKPKNAGKITNTSDYTVYVVDSSWNKLIIRTTGFAVRGHFRLQPCGPQMIDRKLIWVDAFEKHGYKRRPKGEIVHG